MSLRLILPALLAASAAFAPAATAAPVCVHSASVSVGGQTYPLRSVCVDTPLSGPSSTTCHTLSAGGVETRLCVTDPV